MIKIEPTINVEEERKKYDEKMENDAEYREKNQYFYFEKGRELELVIKVTDPFMFQSVFNLFHDKVEGQELLGFKVDSLVTHPERRMDNKTKEKLKSLKEVIDAEVRKWGLE
jgi:hypothetical protein